MTRALLPLLAFLFITTTAAQQNTVGLIYKDDAALYGYTLIGGLYSDSTYLVDTDGHLIHGWPGIDHAQNETILDNEANLWRLEKTHNQFFSTAGSGGRIVKVSWEGDILWQWEYSDSSVCLHHDIEPLPNGNVLAISWEYRDSLQSAEAGIDTAFIKELGFWPDKVIEVKPVGADSAEIVWEWNMWDHLVQQYDSAKANYGDPAEHTELIHINYPNTPGKRASRLADVAHLNGVDYNAELEQIVVSANAYSEIWVIDHSTTTEEAAAHEGGRYGKGGDLLYRYGNPAAYNRGGDSSRVFYSQHDINWIPGGFDGEGNFLVFNNGNRRPTGAYSSADEWTPPMNPDGSYIINSGEPFGPAELTWQFDGRDSSLYGRFVSGAQRMPQGLTALCIGPTGDFYQVTREGEVLWHYRNPVGNGRILMQGDVPADEFIGLENQVFNMAFYAPEFPGFEGRDLSPKGYLERYPTSINEEGASPFRYALAQNYPNPFNPSTTISFELAESGRAALRVYDMLGQEVAELFNGPAPAGRRTVTFDGEGLPSGIYFYRLNAGSYTATKRMLLLK